MPSVAIVERLLICAFRPRAMFCSSPCATSVLVLRFVTLVASFYLFWCWFSLSSNPASPQTARQEIVDNLRAQIAETRATLVTLKKSAPKKKATKTAVATSTLNGSEN